MRSPLALPVLAIAALGVVLLVVGGTDVAAQLPRDAVGRAPDPPSAESAEDDAAVGDDENDAAAVRLRLPALDVEGGWIEVTPLGTDAPSTVVVVGNRGVAEGETLLDVELEPGLVAFCAGGDPYGVTCERLALAPGEPWDVRLEEGLPIVGRYLLDELPAAGARVAITVADLRAPRPFVLPLTADEGGVSREVVTDDEGRFRLPALAAGVYLLETVLPSGRVHRTEPFSLPPPESLAAERPVAEDERLVWDLGDVDVAEGLVLTVRAVDSSGNAMSDIEVTARQGESVADLVAFQATTDADGLAVLSGFDALRPVGVRCLAPGGGPSVESRYELVPVEAECVVPGVASVGGIVLATDGLPVPTARVTFWPRDEEESGDDDTAAVGPVAREPRETAVEDDGTFVVAGLGAGPWRVEAAAPGQRAERIDVELEDGEERVLDPLVLLPGRPLEVRVVEEGSEAPIAGVVVAALRPRSGVLGTTDADGELEIVVGDEDLMVLGFESPDHAPREVTVPASIFAGDDPLVVTLEEGGRVRVVIVDDTDGLPCQGCAAVIVREGRGASRPVRLTMDAAGEATSPPLAGGSYRVTRPEVSHLGSTVVERPAAESESVRVRPGRTTTVRFGERRDTVDVTLDPAPGPGWSLQVHHGGRVDRLLPEPDGTFRVRRRPGATPGLRLERWDATAGAILVVHLADLPSADVDPIVVAVPATEVRAVVATREGPVAGEPVRVVEVATRAWHAATATGPDGSIWIPHLPPGVYSLEAGSNAITFFRVEPGAALDLGRFELLPGGY